MLKVRITLSEDSITSNSKVILGDNIKLYLMEGDVNVPILSSRLNNNLLEVDVEVDKELYDRLKFEDDRILDIVDLDMTVDGTQTLYWTYQGSSLI